MYFEDYLKKMTFEMRKEDLLRQAKEGELSIILGKPQNNKVIGYCISSVVDGIGEVDSICIDEEYRKRGIGDVLMEKSLKW